ncbi:MAG: transcription-repair coupling factor, partial [Brevinematales bacterium]
VRKIPPVEFFKKSIVRLRTGGNIDRDTLINTLVSYQYLRDFKTSEQGYFSVRGDIVDIFPPNYPHGLRLNFLGDEIESIKTFSAASQKSFGSIEEFELIPANEFAAVKEIVSDENRDLLNENSIHSTFPVFYSKLSHILEYASGPRVIVSGETAWKGLDLIISKYSQSGSLPGRQSLIWSLDEIGKFEKDCRRLNLVSHAQDILPARFSPAPEFGEGFSRFMADIEKAYLKNGYRIFLLVEYDDLAKRLAGILKNYNPKIVLSDEDTGDNQLVIIVINFEHGFELSGPGGKILVLSESDISGKKRLFRKRIRQIDTLFEDIEDIQKGEHIVHLNYGIGIFRNIERINVLGKEKDYILLEYAQGEKLYVPLEQSNLIGKYVGGLTKKPVLDSLGGRSWARKKDKVKASIEEYARRLVSIYAKRGAVPGHVFSPDTAWQKDFEDRFEYIETPDQVKVIEEIKRDMESPRPMDRLLCGDVGFGKTEVAMRCAFKAVMDGRQVAMIAPTTVLVEQHYYTFMERFKGFPVRIEFISRFTEPAKLKKILIAVRDHQVDILIGTHKLFSKDLIFHSLGLVIIDEEHKFGVSHKEILKERYPLVDFLSLSATPIPRTLNMAMSTLRDISLLETPPDMRIAVETYVSDFNEDIVKLAIQTELARNGQVFFVHNTIKRLPEYAYLIQKAVPEARIAIGHGQMDEEELEKAFIGFVRGDFNVLVSTTIIDSGLDISNANTIIISDAHRFGLSQLYQLKGRVGRSKRQGFAYFLYPETKNLTETAQKRLFVINEYTNLGAGFNIALKDLEIRGAGNILGHEQHGNIISVGFDVYTRLLREEIEKLQGTLVEQTDTLIDLNYDAFIPESYISDSASKMEIYKKVLSVRSEDEIKSLFIELADRFGAIPAEVNALFEISRLKIRASALGIESIIEKTDNIEFVLSRYSKIDPVKVMVLKQAGRHEISVKPVQRNKIFYKSFQSSIMIKVKRLISFLDDIRES